MNRRLADHRQTELRSSSSLGTDEVRNVACEIMRCVGDPTLHPSIPTKVARAVVERKIPPSEVAEICEIVERKRKANQFRKRPGAYFITSVQRLFQRHEVPW